MGNKGSERRLPPDGGKSSLNTYNKGTGAPAQPERQIFQATSKLCEAACGKPEGGKAREGQISRVALEKIGK